MFTEETTTRHEEWANTSSAASLLKDRAPHLTVGRDTTPNRKPAGRILVQDEQPKEISPDLFGIFFEDLNYAADGGLYAELIQNRSFEYAATEQPTWNNLTAWELVQLGGGHGSVIVSDVEPLHPNNPHYAVLQVRNAGEGVGLSNSGFGGIVVQAGKSYDLSLFARTLFVGERWAPHEEHTHEEDESELYVWEPHEYDHNGTSATAPRKKRLRPLIARLESESGEILDEVLLKSPPLEWTRLSATLTPKKTDHAARFVLLMQDQGGLALDVVSLFPRETFRGHPNGLRPDLAQVIADLKPKFVRFPGGCLVHGNGLGNMYRWKDTVGPIHQRRGQPNLWGYHQSVGLGYFEYFQFCEDIGAKPLPVVAAAVCCQNSGFVCGGHGQKGLPLDEMPAYIQDVLDLIEWANGPADSFWGAKRAEAGHPEPFGLEYLGVGNEDHITPAFNQRFEMIYQAVRAKHPEIKVVGTVGPFHSGQDYDEGWKIANRLEVPLVDEHYYVEPDWFWENLDRYDSYKRSQSAVYLGEYAAHEPDRRNTLRSALAEAAGLTSLERNGDVVRLASYAPLLMKQGHRQWTPDLIYFDNTEICLSLNYYVQQMFSQNAGDVYLPTTAEIEGQTNVLTASCVKDSQNGEDILKIVSRSDTPLSIEISGLTKTVAQASCTVLTGNPLEDNAFGVPPRILPQTGKIEVAPCFDYEVPAHSLSVIRIATAH